MEFINIERLRADLPEIRKNFNRKPFRFCVIENFLFPNKAEEVLAQYPGIADGKWDGTTYIDQKNKFQKTVFDKGSVLDRTFHELNSPEFLGWLSELSGVEDLMGDEKLFGGGLHQSIRGAFLNVHVDYNIHPETKFHRRFNVLVYMNKDWKDEYEGHLELWDMEKKEQVAKVAPLFNRCVIFETSEISYHGHPKPLKTPDGVNRKSLATYYYTKDRPAKDIAPEHNTIYVNTEGLQGSFKRLSSGLKAAGERLLGKNKK